MGISVTFDPSTMYKKKPAMRAKIVKAVQDAPEAPDGAVSATVVNGPHTSQSDSRDHITVDYYDGSGNRLEGRKHVYM
ncbi:hypothetical protein ONS95_013392 [Cadophora gregata]|uniref:uncharacterized protein n=1 Tax=Cadophora gregata TaxID=51156 RepID=UPI0026DAD30D|nr:uncharacterized protein ONS95_013392 [Cadophora gregata]KAK0099715.1 hypothetical protein ONS96_008212 [Cadophora gregata f. sp. sojae]KAK0116372.1 hypothetical protein ONS95_013392 [Cadophora gregata]